MAILSSEVVISGKDNGVGAMFESISAKIDRMAKNAKVSAPFSNLADGLTKAQAQLKALERVDSTKKVLEVAKQRAQITQAALENSRKLVAATEAPTKAMQRDLAAREVAHAKVLAMYDRQAAAATKARQAATDLGLSMQQREAQQEMLAHVIDRTTSAMERQVGVEKKAATQAAALDKAAHARREYIERRGLGHMVTTAAGGFLAAHSVAQGVEHAAIEGANLAHAQNASLSAGIPKLEVAGMTDQALDLSRRYRNVSQESLIELAKEVRSAVVHPDEVPHIMPTLAAAKAVLDGLDKTGEAGHGLGALVKGSEAIGAAQDPARLERLIDGYVKAIQVMGRTISPTEIYDFAKNSRLAGAQFSDRFLMTTAMSSIQELGGQTAGKAANEAVGQLSGAGLGKRTGAVKLLSQLGLVDEKDIVYNKTGEVSRVRKGVLHPVKGDGLLATDPDLFTYNILLPAMEKAGIAKQEDQIAAVRQLYSGSKSAQDLIGKFITQREAYQAHAAQYPQASGIKGAEQMATDPLVAFSSFTTQISNLAANLAQPAVQAAGPALDSIASGLGNLSSAVAQFNKDHPTLAPAVETAGAGAALAGAGIASWYALRGSLGLFGRMLGMGGAGTAEAGATGLAGAAGGEAGAAVGTVGAAGAALPVLSIAGAGLGAGALLVYGSDTSKALVHGGRPDIGQSPSDVLPGLQEDNEPRKTETARLPAFAEMADIMRIARSAPYMPPSIGSAGPDFTLGGYDRGFSAAPTDDTPTGTFQPVSRRRAMKIADNYPEMPATPAALPPAPVLSASPQSVDVAVTVGDPHFEGNLRVAVEPSQWLIGKIDFLSQQYSMAGSPQATVSKPGTGGTMPNAGMAPHVARRDE